MSVYNYTKDASLDRLESEIIASSITIILDGITSNGSALTINFRASLSTSEETTLDGIVAAHVNTPLPVVNPVQQVTLLKNTLEGNPIFTLEKAFLGKSASWTTPDFSDRTTWYFDTSAIIDEVMTTSDNLVYDQARDWAGDTTYRNWINWQRVTERASYTNQKVIVKKNDIVITTGFTIDYHLGKVTFTSANQAEDIIKVSYHYPLSSKYALTAEANTVLKLDYVEVQISKGAVFPEGSYIYFRPIYNGPAVPTYGIPANTDIVLKDYRYYDADDYINSSNKGMVVPPFGRLTKEVIILPWEYLTGKTLKAVGDITTNLANGEFNKLAIELVDANGAIVTDCEIATATFYYRVD